MELFLDEKILVLINSKKQKVFRAEFSYKLFSYDEYTRISYGLLNKELFNQKGFELIEMFMNISSFVFVFAKIPPKLKEIEIEKYKGIFTDCCKGSCDCCGLCCCCNICKNCSNCQPCDICFDYYYCCDILNLARQIVYTIFLRRCCLSCCPLDCLNTISFVIRNAAGVDVGKIELRRTCCTLCGLRGNNSTYTINFPLDATPELKLTIINAVISIDMFLF